MIDLWRTAGPATPLPSTR